MKTIFLERWEAPKLSDLTKKSCHCHVIQLAEIMKVYVVILLWFIESQMIAQALAHLSLHQLFHIIFSNL